MLDQESEATEHYPSQTALLFRTGASTLLIGSGAIIVALVLWSIFTLVFGSADIPLLERLVNNQAGARSISIPGASVQLPAGMFAFTGYGILTALLSISSAIGCSLIKNGVHLIQPDNRKVIDKLIEVQSELLKFAARK